MHIASFTFFIAGCSGCICGSCNSRLPGGRSCFLEVRNGYSLGLGLALGLGFSLALGLGFSLDLGLGLIIDFSSFYHILALTKPNCPTR